MKGDAVFDASGRYRYALSRTWGVQNKRIAFILLNPSTADAERNDPTLRRCIGFARAWGYGALEVVNLFAWRATSPDDLVGIEDPVGTENDDYVKQAVRMSERTVIGWGNRGSLHQRDRVVLDYLTDQKGQVYCFGWTQGGHPRHPLYLSGATRPMPWNVG